MFKSLFTLVKGRTHDAAERVADDNAVTILRQQLRECANAVAAARTAVAFAIAQNEQEITQHAKLVERITDLEKRTVIALEQGKTDLARDAAETISILESESSVSQEAQQRFAAEISRLKAAVRQAEARLRELQRGQRLADATDKTQRMRGMASGNGLSALKEAETTLERLRNRQKEIDATAAAMDEMALSNDPGTMSERLAEAGCGAPLKSSADEVLERLARKTRKTA